jgi:hypothetical protein
MLTDTLLTLVDWFRSLFENMPNDAAPLRAVDYGPRFNIMAEARAAGHVIDVDRNGMERRSNSGTSHNTRSIQRLTNVNFERKQ